MIKGLIIVKRLVMVLAATILVAQTGLNGHMTTEATKTQMMEMTCPHCHEITTVDVMQDEVGCTHCHDIIHIFG